MRQGEVRHFGRERGIGRRVRLALGLERPHMVVSMGSFNNLPGNRVVWVVPASSNDGTAFDPRRLGHVPKSSAGHAAAVVPHERVTRAVLEYVRWGFTGTEPYAGDDGAADFTPAVEAHRQAIRAGADVDQGGVVTQDGLLMAVVSGIAFNTQPGSPLIWTVAAEENATLHPHLIFAVDRREVSRTPMDVAADGLAYTLRTIQELILGLG